MMKRKKFHTKKPDLEIIKTAFHFSSISKPFALNVDNFINNQMIRAKESNGEQELIIKKKKKKKKKPSENHIGSVQDITLGYTPLRKIIEKKSIKKQMKSEEKCKIQQQH